MQTAVEPTNDCAGRLGYPKYLCARFTNTALKAFKKKTEADNFNMKKEDHVWMERLKQYQQFTKTLGKEAGFSEVDDGLEKRFQKLMTEVKDSVDSYRGKLREKGL